MIKLIKKFLLKSKAKKINKTYDNVENLIIEKKYYDALDELIKAVDYSEKVLTLQTYNLHKIHLIFLTNNFELISGISNNCIESIENNTNDNHDVKKYHFLFVYTIMYISSLFINDIKNKELMMKNINELNFKFNSIPDYELIDYPIYTQKRLLTHYKEIGFPNYEEKMIISVLELLRESKYQ